MDFRKLGMFALDTVNNVSIYWLEVLGKQIIGGGMSRDVHAPIEDEKYDFLGRKELAGRIYTRLSDRDCPQAIGIYGGWGTGKTSLLKLIDQKNKIAIHSGNGINIETIDAWSYELVGSLFEPIIVALKDMAAKEVLSSDATKTYLKRMKKFILLGASDIVLRKLGLSLEDAKKLIADANDASGTARSYLDWENVVDDAKSTHAAFENLVQVSLKGLEKEGKYRSDRIVFFIDNLDRCAPETAIQLLESIRNFLTVPGCIWVLAVDADVIASYVSKKYEDTGVDGYSYLDKIVPEQYHLSLSPTLDREGIVALLNSIEEESGNIQYSIDENKIPQIPRVLVPRRLIKSANKFYEYYRDPAVGVNPDMILSLALLYHTWPDFYQRLSSASKEYISGILNHFFDGNNDSLKPKDTLPLSGKFVKDDELIYFIRSAFKEYKNEEMENLLQEMLLALKEMRRLGLP